MNIQEYFAAACTTAGISGLGVCKDAPDAMATFCRSVFGSSAAFGAKRSPITTFYVFTAGPEEPGHGHSRPWVKYGTEFEAYIRDNNLGEITTLGAHLNLKHHAKTTCQTWLWRPDQKALETWWDVYRKAKKKAEPSNDHIMAKEED